MPGRSELAPAVEHLIRMAIEGGRDSDQRRAVYDVLQKHDPEDTRASNAALRALGDAVPKGGTLAQQILLLAIGVLVERGGSPEVAWPAVSWHLKETFIGAAKFGKACLDAVDEIDVQEAVRYAGDKLRKKLPREAADWDMLKSRCIAAVSCLTRSSKVRHMARSPNDDLLYVGLEYDGLIEEVTWFNQAVKIMDDVPLLVLHPPTKRGYRLVMSDVATNVDMFVLLLDKLIGDPKKGFLAGKRPNPKAVQVLVDPEVNVKKTPEIEVFWNLAAWTAVQPDGTTIDPSDQSRDRESHKDWVWFEQTPMHIPVFEGERVLIFQPPAMVRSYDVDPPFEALSPRMELKSKLSTAEVERLIAKMAKAAPAARKARDAWLAKQPKDALDELLEAVAAEAKRAVKKSAKKTATKKKTAAKKKTAKN